MDKNRTTLENRVLRATLGAIIVCGVIVFKHRRLVPIEGHFIRKADFVRLLTTDDKMTLLTPLGNFKVTPA